MELVKMSPKGQLVVPQNIRKRERFISGDRFVPLEVDGGILFKKVRIPDVKVEFEKLAKEIRTKFKKQKVTSEDVSEAIKWTRRE